MKVLTTVISKKNCLFFLSCGGDQYVLFPSHHYNHSRHPFPLFECLRHHNNVETFLKLRRVKVRLEEGQTQTFYPGARFRNPRSSPYANNDDDD